MSGSVSCHLLGTLLPEQLVLKLGQIEQFMSIFQHLIGLCLRGLILYSLGGSSETQINNGPQKFLE